jgi:hypothetical protein
MNDFDETKLSLLKDANVKLNICDNKDLIFIYCPPKVGSTSLVSSLRLYSLNKYKVFHIHDEVMIGVVYGIYGVTINEIINYNNSLDKNIIVIDIYRSPIEHKISSFFEKIGSFHFNNYDEKVNNYDVDKVINRFNKLFPHLSREDYFKNVYDIPFPGNFDFEKKYLSVNKDGIKYIKLRLKDSSSWSDILNDILGIQINIISDYETSKKVIKDLFERFKNAYNIPKNLLEMIENCNSLKYYYSDNERDEYLNIWRNKSIDIIINYYNDSEVKLYKEISMENQYIIDIHKSHYIDDGCSCIACRIKRKNVIQNINNPNNVGELKISHKTNINEYKKHLLKRINNKIIQIGKKKKEISTPKSIIKFNMINQI